MNTPIIDVIITQLAFYVFPPFIAVVVSTSIVLVKKALERLPSKVREVLWDYANTAVKSVEEKADKDWTSEQKKAYAVRKVQLFLKFAHLAVPDELVDHVIDQVVYEIKKNNPPS